MTIENPEVDAPNLEGAAGNQPAVSQGQGSSIEGKPQTSQEFLELKKIVDRQEKELRGLQSRQDKEKTETQRFLDEIKAQVAKGKTIEEAEQIVNADRKAAEKDDLLFKIAQKLGLDESSPSVTGNNATATDDVAQVFTKYKVDPNDPAAVGFLSLKGAELKAAVADYAFTKSQTPTLDSSAAGSIQSSPASKVNQQELIDRLQKLQKEPTKNRAEIKKLEGELGW
jgi:hypothetical protein